MTGERIFGLKYSEILHAAEYDPVKRREAYLRTRELKGRRSGTAIPAGTAPKSSRVIVAGSKSSSSLDAKRAQSKKRREAAEKRVAALKAKLDRLKKIRDELLRQAKVNSGVEPKKDPRSPAQQQSSAKDKSPQTAKEKRDAAKRARESYEKNKKLSPNKEAEALEAQIQDVLEKIRQIRAESKTPVKKSRNQSAAIARQTKSTAVAKAVRQ